MNFGEQIKKLRKQKNLTQEQMASQLGISRQAVSNWENDRNLPDIEMLISIAVTFQISLDDLILGGRDMNNMTEKLIKDGSENRRAKMNLFCIGFVLILRQANGGGDSAAAGMILMAVSVAGSIFAGIRMHKKY